MSDPSLARALNAPTALLPGRYEYSGYSVLAGPAEVPGPGPSRVRMRPLARRRPLTTVLITLFAFAFESTFLAWLLSSIEIPDAGLPAWLYAATVVMIVSTTLIELFRLVNVVTLCLATLWARDPVPMVPDRCLRVAFLTTIVPGKEPVAMVERTLRAARAIRHPGRYDVWLLDEGDDDEVKAMCAGIGVRHFSRRGRAHHNTEAGAFKAKTKHGNYNAWLDRHGHRYDVFMSVDPDHVPVPEYAERMLGYFRDPDVGYVVGPQCYANDERFVTKAAESQQFPFHSVIQRAANAYGVPMLVGTNNAVRLDALFCIGGLADSITEDMATGLLMHSRRNPATGAKWRSVYTPDVVAVGEGPSSWSDYFSQQLRWSRGTFEILTGAFWPRFHRLSTGAKLHYLLITTFYPSMALGWILGTIDAILFLVFGVTGIVVPPQLWLALYIDATLFQAWVYIRNRRYNVSPYEQEGSPGLRGMAMSVLSAPIYASSLIATILRRPAKFVVTPKSDARTRDRLITFRRHLQWAALLAGALVASVWLGYASVEVMMWPALALVISLTPVAIWLLESDRTDTPPVTGSQAVITQAAAVHQAASRPVPRTPHPSRPRPRPRDEVFPRR